MLPSISLAHTYRQLRSEYLPICRAAPVTVDWKHVDRYFDMLGSLPEGPTPSGMTIVSNKVIGADGLGMDIDLLLVVKLRVADPHFEYAFAFDPATAKRKEQDMFGDRGHWSDVNSKCCVLEALIRHRNEVWEEDIRSGRLHTLNVYPMGSSVLPFPLLVTHFAKGDLSDWDTGFEKFPQYYFHRVGLTDIWETQRSDGTVYRMSASVVNENGGNDEDY